MRSTLKRFCLVPPYSDCTLFNYIINKGKLQEKLKIMDNKLKAQINKCSILPAIDEFAEG